jgi:hypothetical protein
MEDYVPSTDFVERTMKKVHAASFGIEATAPARYCRAMSIAGRYAAWAAGAAFGLINLARLYSAVFSPIVCR